MVECEGGFPLLVVSPRLDVLLAHDLIHGIAIIISTTLSRHSSAHTSPTSECLHQLCMAGSPRLSLTKSPKINTRSHWKIWP